VGLGLVDHERDGGAMMRRGLAIVAGVLLGASACMAANYYRQMLMLPRAAGGTAPATLTASVLLHFDEASGATNISDSGKYGLAVTSSTGAQTTNSPTKFDNVFGLNNVTSRRFIVAWTNDFNPGQDDCSVDLWMYFDETTGTNTVLTLLGRAGVFNVINVSKNRGTPGTISVGFSTNGTANRASTFGYDVHSFSNKYCHMAVWRKGNKLYAATNGALVSWIADNTDITGYSATSTNKLPYIIGPAPSDKGAKFMDEFRYCVGPAMPYGTNSFTPPTAPYTGYE
jgi:hypothetical protein